MLIQTTVLPGLFTRLVSRLRAPRSLDASADAIQESAFINGRLFGATEEEKSPRSTISTRTSGQSRASGSSGWPPSPASLWGDRRQHGVDKGAEAASAWPLEIRAAIVTVGVALGHPILRRAAASAAKGGLRRETPVLLASDDGSLIEGVVDLAFREDTSDFKGWTVVDFKTDRDFAASSVHYLAQVRLYSRAIRVATDLPNPWRPIGALIQH
jgi:hypothetical protein